jgi:hypothetical protein
VQTVRARCLAAGLGAILSLLGLGCQSETTCAAAGSPCGGGVTGSWTVSDACRDPAEMPPLQTTYQGQPAVVARQPPPQTASSDWCSSLVYGPPVTGFAWPHDTLAVASGHLTYAADGTYQAVIDTEGPGGIDLSAACLTRFGMAPTCDQVQAALVDFAAAAKGNKPSLHCTDSLSEPSNCDYYRSADSIACTNDGEGGCACTYHVAFAGTFSGTWTASGGVLTHFDATGLLPSQADYCVSGASGALTLWGHGGTSLFDEPGIGRLSFTPAAP